MPTPPPTDVIALHDDTPHEIETRAELEIHLSAGTLGGLVILDLDLDGTAATAALSSVDVRDALFVGCRFASPEVSADLVRRGALVVPSFDGVPYPTHPGRLYTPDDLAAGFARGGFDSMYDTVVYHHFRAAGGAQPAPREALVQRLHDSGIDNALAATTDSWVGAHGRSAAIGVMGGHAVLRGSTTYRLAATLGRELARADRLVVTGGGPGVMEAANLGAFLAERTTEDLAAAVDTLAAAPDFRDHDPYTAAALKVRADFAADSDGGLGWARHGGLSIPTWLYGHEPANLFAARIAKYFSNAIREDTILRLSRGGIVFAPGWAGTVQEIFQAATKTFYATDGVSGPYVFLDTAYWTQRLPVRALLEPLLANAPVGDLSGLIHVTDDVAEAVALLTAAP
ncbi:LOG family protein [Planosporangium sp. 12N6]|uniref:LOG family protein n=1 Tax=Planosporangium spinosum TaxID=3402278 RepID=UPI003CF99ABC